MYICVHLKKTSFFKVLLVHDSRSNDSRSNNARSCINYANMLFYIGINRDINQRKENIIIINVIFSKIAVFSFKIFG